MPKKKKSTSKKNSDKTPSTGDPMSSADNTQFLQVAGALLANNDASTDLLRNEVTELRERHISQKRAMESEKDELIKSREHIQHNLDKSKVRTKELETQVETLEQDKITHLEQITEQNEERRRSNNEEVRSIRDSLDSVTRELQTLSEFRDKKDEHDIKITKLTAKNETTVTKYEERLRLKDVELQEQTEHLIQRLNQEVQRTREEMMSKMRAELDATTKHTMEENARLQTELQFQSHRINKLVKDNNTLIKKNKEYKRDISSYKEMELSNAKRIRFYARLFQRMQLQEDERKLQESADDAERVQKESNEEKQRKLRILHGDSIMEHRYDEIDQELNSLLKDGGSLLLSGITDQLLNVSEIRNKENDRLRIMMEERSSKLIENETKRKLKLKKQKEDDALRDELTGGSSSSSGKGGRPGRNLRDTGGSMETRKPESTGSKKGQWSFPAFVPPAV